MEVSVLPSNQNTLSLRLIIEGRELARYHVPSIISEARTISVFWITVLESWYARLKGAPSLSAYVSQGLGHPHTEGQRNGEPQCPLGPLHRKSVQRATDLIPFNSVCLLLPAISISTCAYTRVLDLASPGTRVLNRFRRIWTWMEIKLYFS